MLLSCYKEGTSQKKMDIGEASRLQEEEKLQAKSNRITETKYERWRVYEGGGLRAGVDKVRMTRCDSGECEIVRVSWNA